MHRLTFHRATAIGLWWPKRHSSTYTKTEHEDLLRTIRELQAMITQRDELIRTLIQNGQCPQQAVTAPFSNPNCSATTTVVATDEDLEHALRERVPMIRLQPGRRFTLLPQPFQLRDAHVALLGPGTIEMSLNLSNSVLDATGITFVAPSRSIPVVDATNGCALRMSRCSFEGGRDGIFLSNQSRATVTHCTLRNNVRGVFEGHGCEARVFESTFEGNLFHAVLLSKPSTHARALDFCSQEGTHKNRIVVSEDTRADVALQYNPMSDVYMDVLKEGRPVVLTAEESTTNLCDPSW